MSRRSPSSAERRAFLTGLGDRGTSLAAVAVGAAAVAQGKTKAPARWEPARHEKDDWLDQVPGVHRLVFDTTTADGFGEALAFAGNFLRVNHSDYGLEDGDLAVVIIARHRSTPFAYSDAIWTKYGAAIAKQSGFEDPKSKLAPTLNVYNSADYGRLLQNRGTTVESLTKRGVRLAVCSSATRAYAGTIAQAVGGKADDINAELRANLMSNGRMVPAGIVAVNRAQERGYSLVRT